MTSALFLKQVDLIVDYIENIINIKSKQRQIEKLNRLFQITQVTIQYSEKLWGDINGTKLYNINYHFDFRFINKKQYLSNSKFISYSIKATKTKFIFPEIRS